MDTSTTNSCPFSGYCRRTYQGFLWQGSGKTSGIRICCATTLPFDGPESVVFSVHSFVSRSCQTEWTQAPRILVQFLDTVVAHTKDSCGKCLGKRVASESAVPRHYPLMDQNPRGVFCPRFREPQLPNGVDTSTTNSCPFSGYCRRTY